MKLNLLPSSISKSAGSKSALVLAIVIIAMASGFTFLLIGKGQKAKQSAVDKANEQRPKVQIVMGIADSADVIIQQVGPIDRNLKLVKAMEAHNTVYTSLYRDVMNYIPDFYRITSLNAAPGGESTTISMSGVLKTEQQYADLALALLRIPGVSAVSRSGFVFEHDFIPNLTPEDQDGTRIKQGETNLPSDPLDQMEALIQRANTGPRGFQNVGQFGTGEGPRGAMPKWSNVNMTLILAKNILTPNPRATIEQQGAAPAGNARGRGNTAGFGGGR